MTAFNRAGTKSEILSQRIPYKVMNVWKQECIMEIPFQPHRISH